MRKFDLFSPKIRSAFLLTAILAVVFFSFSPVLKNEFVFWDDDVHLYENINVRSLDREHVGDIFKSTVNKIYIPLTIFSFALEYHFFEYDPFVYHLNNLLLHLAVVACVFWLGRLLGLSAAASGIAALLFGIHPMRVESVAWVTERKDVLYAFFYILALISYTKYLNFTHSTSSLQIKKSYRFLVLTCVLGVLSMLAKPMALSLPLILLLLDWFHERKIGKETIVEKIPLAVLIAGIALVSYIGNARIPGQNILQGMIIWVWTFIYYVRQFIFPAVSVPVQILPKPIHISNPEYFLSLIAFAALVAVLVRFRKRPWLIFAVAYYILSIFFLLRFDETKDLTIVADRFMYLPSLGFCFLVGAGWTRLTEGHKIRSILGILAVLILTGILSIKTFNQCQIWNNSISLWRYQLTVYPNEPIALNNLAAALREEEEYKKAEQLYKKYLEVRSDGIDGDFSDELKQSMAKVDYLKSLYAQAIESSPGHKESYYNLGNLMKDLGNIAEAIIAYKETLKLDYKYKDAHFSLGDIYRMVGDHRQAIFAYDQTITVNPKDEDVYFEVISAYNQELKKNPQIVSYLEARDKVMKRFIRLINSQPPRASSYFNLGSLFGEMGDSTRAIEAYQMALYINSNHSNTLYNLGNVYRDQGRMGDALALYERVLKTGRNRSNAYLNIGTIYRYRGDWDNARKNFSKAIIADETNAKAYFGLGFIEEKAGNLRKSADFYKKSIEIDYNNKESHYNLGNVYAKMGKNKEALTAYLAAVGINPGYMDAWVNLSVLSFKEKNFSKAVEYCDTAMLLGYIPPQGYWNALELYRKKEK